MASQGSKICRRAIRLTDFAPPDGLALMKNVLDQYETVAHLSGARCVFLMGVTEFYRARTDTKITIAAESLAVIAAIPVPIDALSSVLGMHVIFNEQTRWGSHSLLLLIMLITSLILLHWAPKQGWW
jgi:magnesium transporter